MSNKVRIIKFDSHNYAVQVLKDIEVTETVGGKRTKTGATREDWVDVGYFGHRLDWAAESAVHQYHASGEVVTGQTIRDAVASIVAQTKESLGG